MKTIRLREGRERSLLRRHPWVFAGSIAGGGADAGETVRVVGADGRFLAWAAYSPASSIRLRAWSFDEAQRIDRAFFAHRIEAALALRQQLPIDSNARRLVHGEADGLPGLVVDQYGDTLVAQFGAAGAERWKPLLTALLAEASGCARVYERSDAGVRQLEALPPATGWLQQPATDDSRTLLQIIENGLTLELDIAGGHKTGFYLDQRDNRRLLAELVQQRGLRRVLNCYCYSGGFTLAALRGGAREVTSVDSSAAALALARRNFELNLERLPAGARCEFTLGDVPKLLRQVAADGRRFDAIVLDPPKLAPNAAAVDRAARAYKDINRLALGLLAPGGLLLTFSCSGAVGVELWHKIVAGAAIDAGADAVMLQRLQAAPDHPTTLLFPEGEYLKGLLLLKSGTAANAPNGTD